MCKSPTAVDTARIARRNLLWPIGQVRLFSLRVPARPQQADCESPTTPPATDVVNARQLSKCGDPSPTEFDYLDAKRALTKTDVMTASLFALLSSTNPIPYATKVAHTHTYTHRQKQAHRQSSPCPEQVLGLRLNGDADITTPVRVGIATSIKILPFSCWTCSRRQYGVAI